MITLCCICTCICICCILCEFWTHTIFLAFRQNFPFFFYVHADFLWGKVSEPEWPCLQLTLPQGLLPFCGDTEFCWLDFFLIDFWPFLCPFHNYSNLKIMWFICSRAFLWLNRWQKNVIFKLSLIWKMNIMLLLFLFYWYSCVLPRLLSWWQRDSEMALSIL